MRSGARLRVSLERERRPVDSLDTLQASIEERAMRRADVLWERVLLDCEAVVLARDHHAARVELDDGVIRAVMTELHLLRLGPARKTEQLMAQADAECRHAFVHERADGLDRVVARLRVAGAVRQEHAVG